jgi:NADP-reducing hydrogenase subunit HndA
MPNKKTNVPFTGTPEQERELRQILFELKGQAGALMPALQKAQHIYGYLPIEVQKIVSEELGVHLEEVYGVATFYSQFSLNPKGKYKVSVCLGTACYVKGAGDILDKVSRELGIKGGECTADGKFSLEACRCIGACGLAPVLTINDDVYGRLVADDIPDIVKKYKAMD